MWVLDAATREASEWYMLGMDPLCAVLSGMTTGCCECVCLSVCVWVCVCPRVCVWERWCYDTCPLWEHKASFAGLSCGCVGSGSKKYVILSTVLDFDQHLDYKGTNPRWTMCLHFLLLYTIEAKIPRICIIRNIFCAFDIIWTQSL